MYLAEGVRNASRLNSISLGANLVIGIVVAIVSARVTVSLALRRFYAEKWWERKWEAYTGIINALHHMKNYDDHHLAFAEHSIDLPEEANVELTQKTSKCNG